MGEILIIIGVLESRFTNVIISYELLDETEMCCKEHHSKNIICEVLPFCFVLIYRLCQINRHQKRMTVLYRKQWSICLDGNLSLTGSWWESSETIISHWCVDIALKTDIGFFWAQLLSEYKSTLSLRLRTNWLYVLFYWRWTLECFTWTAFSCWFWSCLLWS